jgi:hypothetical protein
MPSNDRFGRCARDGLLCGGRVIGTKGIASDAPLAIGVEDGLHQGFGLVVKA